MITSGSCRSNVNLLKLKAELILTHCDDQFLVDGSNILYTTDKDMVGEVLALLRDQKAKFRVEVKPENLSITDFKELQSERVAVLQGVTSFMQAIGPVLQQNPQAAPPMLELLKWTLVGFRGSNSIEAVLDQFIAQTKQQLQQAAMQPPQPDPKVEAIKEKAKLDVGVAREKAKIQLGTMHQKNQIDQQKLGIEKQRADMDIQKQMHQMQIEAMRPKPAPGEHSHE